MCRPDAGASVDYYLGVDPSISNTGVVLLDSACRLVAFADGKSFVTRGCKGFERYMEQARGIAKFVSDNAELGSEIMCGYEGYSYNSEHRAFDMAEYGGVLKNALLQRSGMSIWVVPPAVLKLFGTGSGTATKAMMTKQAAEEEPSLSGASNDVCDAFFLAKFAAAADGRRHSCDKALMRRRVEAVRRYLDGGRTEIRVCSE